MPLAIKACNFSCDPAVISRKHEQKKRPASWNISEIPLGLWNLAITKAQEKLGFLFF